MHANSAPVCAWKECRLLFPKLLILHLHLQLLLLFGLALSRELLVFLVAFNSFIVARTQLLDQACTLQVLENAVDLPSRGSLFLQ